ncbi:MAG TPA: carboxylating nicotinate-nucleotide diphosphorylase [Candidatus Acidoferrales bacterium]|jgi:nicotinate-nucleotide pyrophosphorylase (carboxylating)|nr:carboxylating nicotinate-nucleotide diphosphorylase [Candidatus Acidoferrales bacterium]
MDSGLQVARSRRERLLAALFRGASLTLDNSRYRDAVHALTNELLRSDLEPADLTVEALGLAGCLAEARIVALEPGVVAGLEEAAWLYDRFGLSVERFKADGERVNPDEAVLQVRGDSKDLLRVERLGLNLIQRMSGIATVTRHLQDLAHSRAPETSVVATRKTPWGLLDKRAVHLGGGGTHRLGLWDAILIKNNHLLFFGDKEGESVSLALKRAWPLRREAAFVEVEVTGSAGARAAGRTFRDLQQAEPESCPCLIMLDNVKPDEAARIIAMLQTERLWDHVLVEASGKISEAAVEAYAACGVDAISVGALTHSCRALDLRARAIPRAG